MMPEFVFEIANNHWGSVDRGIEIIKTYSQIARYENIKAAIKLQFRHVPSFIHKNYLNSDLRYIKKTIETALTKDQFEELVLTIKKGGCIPKTTCFDETTVQWAQDLGIEILKIASSDINDWSLIERMAQTRLPIIASTGGSSRKDIEDLVIFCMHRNIPLSLNHCIALYPTPPSDLNLHEIDVLRQLYPANIIGLSTHEAPLSNESIQIAYAKGARTFERHVDIPYLQNEHPVSLYCSLPDEIVGWIEAWKRAKILCGTPNRVITEKETQYLDSLVRGMYAKRDLEYGDELTGDNIYYAIPLQRGQLSCREVQIINQRLIHPIKQDAPIMIDHINCSVEGLVDKIKTRGL